MVGLNNKFGLTKDNNVTELSRYPHTFHIPVMGTAFTIDTPVRIARYGVSSVMSIGDDHLCETMRAHYCQCHDIPYQPIDRWDPDARARRIRAYLDLVHELSTHSFHALCASPFQPGSASWDYVTLLPDSSPLKEQMAQFQLASDDQKPALEAAIKSCFVMGSLDVNIMTKLDRSNYDKQGNLLPETDSDALSALRGYATSQLDSGIVLSAGFNRRLYAYVAQFDDFFPDHTGHIKKRIILKVSDFRSAQIQGRFLAKKGIWVSEYRVESGLNCGGHAFATDGYLMGPILEEFKQERMALLTELHAICNEALLANGRATLPLTPLARFTVQGGIGTHEEDQLLRHYYQLDGTGWGTPFLLVPEVTNVDDDTRRQLAATKRDGLYTSGISPLGVPFNTYKGSPSEVQKYQRAADGKPGSPCPKGFLVSNTEYTTKPICTASSVFQKKKLAEIAQSGMSSDEQAWHVQSVIDKACLCEDLAASALLRFGIDNKRPLKTAVCPGPNLAYFSKIISFADMVAHIYGRLNVMDEGPRPHLFVEEARMYVTHFLAELKASLPAPPTKRVVYLRGYFHQLRKGLDYYVALLANRAVSFAHDSLIRSDLAQLRQELDRICQVYAHIMGPETPTLALG